MMYLKAFTYDGYVALQRLWDRGVIGVELRDLAIADRAVGPDDYSGRPSS